MFDRLSYLHLAGAIFFVKKIKISCGSPAPPNSTESLRLAPPTLSFSLSPSLHPAPSRVLGVIEQKKRVERKKDRGLIKLN